MSRSSLARRCARRAADPEIQRRASEHAERAAAERRRQLAEERAERLARLRAEWDASPERGRLTLRQWLRERREA
jgi:hypothetical protein